MAPDAMAQYKKEWEELYSHLPMPPPPPGLYPNREEVQKAAKTFAKKNGYEITVGSAKRGNVRWKMKCSFLLHIRSRSMS